MRVDLRESGRRTAVGRAEDEDEAENEDEEEDCCKDCREDSDCSQCDGSE